MKILKLDFGKIIFRVIIILMIIVELVYVSIAAACLFHFTSVTPIALMALIVSVALIPFTLMIDKL